jgi:Protein of unknown function (DUF1524)
VRWNINAVWRTVYEELGRNPKKSLDDDAFLRAHWIVFFGYDKDQADPLTQFLLHERFTASNIADGTLTLQDIQTYIDSLQQSAQMWQRLHFPLEHRSVLGEDVAVSLARLRRLDVTVLQPLLMAALSSGSSHHKCSHLFDEAERFLLLVRGFTPTRSDVAEAESYRAAHEVHARSRSLPDAADVFSTRVKGHFSPLKFQEKIDGLFDERKGFYDLASLKFVLFEYEESLRRGGKSTEAKLRWSDFRGEKDSVEHIYPQWAEDAEWPQFKSFSDEQKHLLMHSLGNLVAVSVAKNASLRRRSFADKKKGTDKIPGFSQGSFSELKVAQCSEWSPVQILERGLELLAFIENRWRTYLGDHETKVKLLKLDGIEL